MSGKDKRTEKGFKKENESAAKYSWKFWCVVIAEIAVLTVIVLWLCLSVKAIVQDFQMLCFENRAKGTVIVAEYEGENSMYNTVGSGTTTEYEHVRYVIKFDNYESGYSQYEFHADNIITSRKYEGQRFLVLFNEIDNPTLIFPEAFRADNFFLVSFVIFCVTVVAFRKRIFVFIKKAGEKLDDLAFDG